MSKVEKALKKIADDKATLHHYELVSTEFCLDFAEASYIKEYLFACGLRTLETSYEDEIYCVVDIETTGSKPENSQVIEIGAIKYFRGKQIDTFESFVYCEQVPENITEVTHITSEDLIFAPRIKDVLMAFKLFLSDTVFVAHNVNFDANYLSRSFVQNDLGPMLNPKLCTIDLSRRCIDLQKYGLKSMIEYFGFDGSSHHRAFFDATVSLRVLQECFEKLPWYVESLDDLIVFSKSKIKKSKTALLPTSE